MELVISPSDTSEFSNIQNNISAFEKYEYI